MDSQYAAKAAMSEKQYANTVRAKNPTASYEVNGSEVRPASIVEEALDGLANKRFELEESLTQLCNRLDPILTPIPADCMKPAQVNPLPICGQVVSRIRMEYDNLHALKSRVQDILDHLEV